jgi:hypothetical protein
MRSTLVASQAALTVVLVAGAFSMGRTFLRVIGTDLGYRADRLVTLNVSLAGTRYASGDLEKQYYGEAIGRLRTLPGVESAAAVSYLPLMETTTFPGGVLKLDSGEKGPPALFIAATPESFRTMGVQCGGPRGSRSRSDRQRKLRPWLRGTAARGKEAEPGWEWEAKVGNHRRGVPVATLLSLRNGGAIAGLPPD